MGVSEQNAPFVEPYARAGNANGFRSKGNTALAVKRALSHLGFFLPWDPPSWDLHWNERCSNAAAEWKRKRGLIPADSNDGSWGKKAHDVMRSAWYEKNGEHLPAFDGESQRLLRKEKAGSTPPPDEVGDIGPVWKGGLSLLDHDCTHATSGIDLYPAFDDCFDAGREIIAPEHIEVTRSSSSNPGDAFYASGAKLDYWFGHLISAPSVGREFAKGAVVGTVLDHDIGGGPHVHVGVNVERLWGDGRELKHHTDYTHGAPTIGEQILT